MPEGYDHLVTREELNGSLTRIEQKIDNGFDKVYNKIDERIDREQDKRGHDVRELHAKIDGHCADETADKLSTSRKWLYMIVGGIGGAAVSVGLVFLTVYIQSLVVH